MNIWADEEEQTLAISELYFKCIVSVSHLNVAIIISTQLTLLHSQRTPFMYSRTKGIDNGGGSGWLDDGKVMYENLFCQVKQNRIMYGKTFNQDLLKIYQQQRNKGNGGSMMKQGSIQTRKDPTDVRMD